MTSFRDFLKEQLRDKNFAGEYQEISIQLDLSLALTQRREELGLTQQALAAITGIKQPMIARIERGQIPKPVTLQRLAKALQVRIVFTADGVFTEPVVDVSSLQRGVKLQSKVVDIAQYRRNRKPWVGHLPERRRVTDNATLAVGLG
ncbi:MAG TPA: helix-turn-helix transcriptional regulator [Pyrinomonadaceae bacterium]|jgi:transcriptional regulator with XRE-family HTH domain|nr:helix-turn-helix transcriptional regulator [Pyrinomonadaceae bacterium]